MDYVTIGTLLRQDGIALIGLGSFFIGLGWHALRNADKIHVFVKGICSHVPRLVSDVLILLLVAVCLITGARYVGEGGNRTTQGWNTMRKHYEKEALIRALARDWSLNQLKLHVPPFTIPDNDPNFGKLHKMYPRFTTSAMRSILQSDLFTSNDTCDADLLGTLILYEMVANDINEYLPLIDEQMLRTSTHTPERLAKYRAIQRSPQLTALKKAHTQLGTHLHSHYSQLLSHAQEDIKTIRNVLEERPQE